MKIFLSQSKTPLEPESINYSCEIRNKSVIVGRIFKAIQFHQGRDRANPKDGNTTMGMTTLGAAGGYP